MPRHDVISQANEKESIKPLSILVVEDHQDSAQSLAELLVLYGHSPRISSCGEDALREVVVNPPDVVLLDVGMPVMTGWELARRLKALQKPPILIAITGYGQEADHRKSAESGIHLHLVKPVDPAQLVGILKRVAETITTPESSDCPI